MIRIDIRGKHFGATPVLGPLELMLEAGETVAVTGPSGIGKSTLLRIIAGLDADFDGDVTRTDRIAMAFQEPTLLPWREARRNITLVTGASASAADAALAEVGLGGMETRFPGQLSLGQQRRLSLARALSAAPELLLLDEPFVSLDPALAAEMIALTAALLARRRIAAILVTHDMTEAGRLAGRILRLDGHPATLHEIGTVSEARDFT
jgi:NitT/TauT family transport system ATP-binding protein